MRPGRPYCTLRGASSQSVMVEEDDIRGLSVTVEIPGDEAAPAPGPSPAPSPAAASPSPSPDAVSAPAPPSAPDTSVPVVTDTPVPSVAVPEPPAPVSLPRTGADLAGWLLVAVLLLILGIALVRSSSRQGART